MLKNIEVGTSNNTCEEDHDDDKLKFSWFLLCVSWTLHRSLELGERCTDRMCQTEYLSESLIYFLVFKYSTIGQD